MYKRESNVPLVELEQELILKEHKKMVIDITAPPLKLQKNRADKLQHNKSKRVLRPLGRSSNPKPSQIHQQKQSLLYESKTTPQTFDEIPSPENSDSYMFSLKRWDDKEFYRWRMEKRSDITRRVVKYQYHEHDKMYSRIQSVEVNFRPMTVEESVGIGREQNHGKKSQAQDRFKRFKPLRKYYKVYPTLFINKDHKRGLFAIEVNRPESTLNIEHEHRMHDQALSKALERLSEPQANDDKNCIFRPKPATKYCYVCKSHYDEYIQHIETRCHKQNDSNAKIWPSIKEICKKVQGLAVEEKLKHLKWKHFEDKQNKKAESNTEKSKNNLAQHQSARKTVSQEKHKDKRKKRKEKSNSKHRQTKCLPKNKQNNLNCEQKQSLDVKPFLPKSSAQKQAPPQSPKQLHTALAQHQHEETPMPNVIIKQPQLKNQQSVRRCEQKTVYVKKDGKQVIKSDKFDQKIVENQVRNCEAKMLKSNQSESLVDKQQKGQKNDKKTEQKRSLEQRKVELQPIQKAVKSNIKVPIIAETEIQVSILHSEYPKLVPEGQTYRKPSKPATVSLCLTESTEEKKQETKRANKKREKSEKKKEINKFSSAYKQQTIQEWCHVKKAEKTQYMFSKEKPQQIVSNKLQQIVQEPKVSQIEQEMSQKKKECKDVTCREQTNIKRKKCQPIQQSTPEQSSGQKPRFAWLAKTRQRERKTVKSSDHQQLSPILTE